jgi:vancomycin resistance protein YoaR
MDATIYLPKPDFKFVNTTDRHILVQGQVVGNKVIFELWGTSDGRTVSISDPAVTNITEPGEPIYADTDTLVRGETKQIEKPHQGATASFVYIVTKDGKEINKQTFKSIYKAWPARFLVGTRDPAAPPPTP